jgi:hypothetical protein
LLGVLTPAASQVSAIFNLLLKTRRKRPAYCDPSKKRTCMHLEKLETTNVAADAAL